MASFQFPQAEVAPINRIWYTMYKLRDILPEAQKTAERQRITIGQPFLKNGTS